ncbi:MAG: DUF4440 domain-containing protein [Chthonomonas sp.]|nr:DUF4440 domain-containing protein [Chthonomonas sp.]
MAVRGMTAVALVGLTITGSFSQSNARENAVLQKLKAMYKELDLAIQKQDIDKAATYYSKDCLVYPIKGKPIEILDAIIARTDQFDLAKKISIRTSTKTIRVNGNSAQVVAVITVVATLPQRGFPDRTVEVRVRSVTEDQWKYSKGWRITQVKSLEDQMWFDGKLQGATKKQ